MYIVRGLCFKMSGLVALGAFTWFWARSRPVKTSRVRRTIGSSTFALVCGVGVSLGAFRPRDWLNPVLFLLSFRFLSLSPAPL